MAKKKPTTSSSSINVPVTKSTAGAVAGAAPAKGPAKGKVAAKTTAPATKPAAKKETSTKAKPAKATTAKRR